jgi:enoyl-CoA hydratase/carnithine racemase
MASRLVEERRETPILLGERERFGEPHFVPDERELGEYDEPRSLAGSEPTETNVLRYVCFDIAGDRTCLSDRDHRARGYFTVAASDPRAASERARRAGRLEPSLLWPYRRGAMETIRLETNGVVAWIRLNRPKAMNALSPELVDELDRALAMIERDDGVRVAVVIGTGRAFSAGADLAFASESISRGDPAPMTAFVERIGAVFGRLSRFAKPVIAAVNGLALAGGLELLLCCDLVVAAESAKIGDAHANYGLLPGAGNAARLPKRIGSQRAKQLLFTGEFVAAADLVAAGLVNRVVPDAHLEREVQALAETIAAKSPLGLRRMKQVADASLALSDEAALRLERRTLAEHFESEDVREGLAAFRDKRKPEFRGR